MGNLLHERLREYASFDGIAINGTCCCFTRTEAEAIAEEIERDYIPRAEYDALLERGTTYEIISRWANANLMPFEDGQSITEWLDKWFIKKPTRADGVPVSKGMEVGDGIVDGWCVWDDTAFTINDDEGNVIQEADPGDFVMDASPKMLDADGVRIYVGDTVWRILKVSGNVIHGEVLELIPETGKVKVNFTSWHGICTACANALTHKEPDSLEKLRDELDAFMRDCEINADKVDEFTSRLTALMERGA